MRRLCSCAIAVLLVMLACSCDLKDERVISAGESTWPDSAEFSTLESGQDRFSVHCTNLGKWRVLVDHETGVQYIVSNTVNAVCPLLDADGSPLLVLEAGE